MPKSKSPSNKSDPVKNQFFKKRESAYSSSDTPTSSYKSSDSYRSEKDEKKLLKLKQERNFSKVLNNYDGPNFCLESKDRDKRLGSMKSYDKGGLDDSQIIPETPKLKPNCCMFYPDNIFK